MKKRLLKNKFVAAIAGLLILTFLIPASSQAAGVILVPVAGLAIWGVTVVATGVAALFETDGSQTGDAPRQTASAADNPDPSATPAPVALKLQPGEG